MYSKLSSVVVNPPWNAPTRLINEDLLPKMKADPSYIAAHNYSILDSAGNVIDPYSINWASIGNKFDKPLAIVHWVIINLICQAQMPFICMTRQIMGCLAVKIAH